MPDNRPRTTALGPTVLRACCQGNALYRKLLADPNDPYIRWFARTHSLLGGLVISLSGLPGMLALARMIWEKTVPGGLLHFLARKRFVEEQIHEAIEAGLHQLVLFGTGYDSLGVRLARERSDLQIFEVDHPPTQAVKLLGLEKRMIKPANLHFLPVDFRKGTLERHLLQADKYDADLYTLFVAERVLPYLPEMEVDEIFNFVWEHGAIKSRVIFSVLDSVLLNDPSSLLFREAKKVAAYGRPFRSSIDTTEIEKFLFQRGLKGMGFAGDDFIAEHFLKPLGFHKPQALGEMVVVAEKADWAKWMVSRKVEKTSFHIFGKDS